MAPLFKRPASIASDKSSSKHEWPNIIAKIGSNMSCSEPGWLRQTGWGTVRHVLFRKRSCPSVAAHWNTDALRLKNEATGSRPLEMLPQCALWSNSRLAENAWSLEKVLGHCYIELTYPNWIEMESLANDEQVMPCVRFGCQQTLRHRLRKCRSW